MFPRNVRKSSAGAIAAAVAGRAQRSLQLLWPLLAAAALWASAASAAVTPENERRVALVIGNSAYRAAPALPNPVRDAEAMAASLERLGFEVIKGMDLDQAELSLIVREFAGRLAGADVAMLFYAGHGLQVGGRNYLVPVDAELDQELDLDFEAVGLDLVLRQMEREPRVNLVFLDACRDNPLAQTLARSMGAARSTAIGRGLALVEGSVGSFIAYSTQPGNVALDGDGLHSPFAGALLTHIETPGLSLSDMMAEVRSDVIAATDGKQVPWDHSSLTGGFYFRPQLASLAVAGDKPIATEAPAVQVAPAVDKEVVFWESIKDSTNPADFEAYLTQFPQGTFAPLAKARVANLQAKPAAPATTDTATLTTDESTATPSEEIERSLGLTRQGRSRVQLALTLLGYKTGGTDGKFGPKTRNAIMAFQADRGEEATGYLTAPQHADLLDQAAPKIAAYEAEQKRKAEIAAAEERRRQQDAAALAKAQQDYEAKKAAAAAAEAERLRKENEALKKAQAAKEAEESGPDVDIGLGIGVGGGGVSIFPGLRLGY